MVELCSTGPRCKWALEELNIDHKSRIVDFANNEHQTAEYKAIHPLGRVPAYRTAQYTMQESVAIVLQLLDEHPQMGLAPAPGTPARAHYYQYCVLACAELDPAQFDIMKHTMHLPVVKRVPEIARRAQKRFEQLGFMLSGVLEAKDYLLGDDFSGADIVLGYDLNWAAYTGTLDVFPRLKTYYARLQARPAFQRVFTSN